MLPFTANIYLVKICRHLCFVIDFIDDLIVTFKKYNWNWNKRWKIGGI